MKNKKMCKRLKGFVKEEKKASEKYKKLGFKEQSEDEMKHSKFFQNKYNQECR